MHLELSSANPTPLESLLVQRVLACWVQVSFADTLAAQTQERKAAYSELRYLQKRQESAGRCLTEAVKQLILIRKLLRLALSPVELAMWSVAEGNPTAGGRVASTPDLRLAELN